MDPHDRKAVELLLDQLDAVAAAIDHDDLASASLFPGHLIGLRYWMRSLQIRIVEQPRGAILFRLEVEGTVFDCLNALGVVSVLRRQLTPGRREE